MSKSYLVVGQRYVGSNHYSGGTGRYIPYARVHKTADPSKLLSKLYDTKSVDVWSLWEVKGGKIVKSRD